MSNASVPKTDQWDVPLGGLRPQARVRLERTQLEAAVAEVRLLSQDSHVSADAASKVWDVLGRDVFPVFEAHAQNTIKLAVTPQGAQQLHETQHGWVLTTPNRETAVTLLPGSIIVQTVAYDRFSSSLGAPLRSALEAFVEATGSRHVQRLGLRYVNRLTDAAATAPTFWCDHVTAPFAGPLNGPVAGLVTGQHQQTQLQLETSAGARIQTGVFQEQAAQQQFSYLVDLDVFREQAMPYDAVVCANYIRQLNRTALALFASVLSDRYLESLGPVVLEAPETREEGGAQT